MGCPSPLSLSELAQGLAGHCGLTLRGDFPDYSVPAFTAIGLTGRQLMQWIAQACGCFCAADPEGALELRWLRDRGLDIGPSGDTFYYQGTLELSEYDCAPIDRLHIGLSDTDTGLSHPESGENTLSIRGNYLLTGDNGPLIRTLYDKLAGLSYPHCVLETNAALQPGDLFTVHYLKRLIEFLRIDDICALLKHLCLNGNLHSLFKVECGECTAIGTVCLDEDSLNCGKGAFSGYYAHYRSYLIADFLSVEYDFHFLPFRAILRSFGFSPRTREKE